MLKAHLKRTQSAISARKAAGVFSGRLSLAGKNGTFTWTLTFAKLSGPARQVGIYYGRAAKPSRLALLLCNKCTSGIKSYYHGSYVAQRRFVRAILHGRAYVVIQTKRNPNGEVRGRIRTKVA